LSARFIAVFSSHLQWYWSFAPLFSTPLPSSPLLPSLSSDQSVLEGYTFIDIFKETSLVCIGFLHYFSVFYFTDSYSYLYNLLPFALGLFLFF
jgi:hypothetical protein